MHKYDDQIAAMMLKQSVGLTGGSSICDRYESKPVQKVQTKKTKKPSKSSKKSGSRNKS
jgi:hypothetical protein